MLYRDRCSDCGIGKRYNRQEFKPDAPGLASLQWDSAELIQIDVQNQMNYDDAFTLEQVDKLTDS